MDVILHSWMPDITILFQSFNLKKSLERHKIMIVIQLKVISFMPPRFLRNRAGQIMYLLNQAAFLYMRMVPKS